MNKEKELNELIALYAMRTCMNNYKDRGEELLRLFLKEYEQVKSVDLADVVKSLPNDDEIEQAANENADRIFGDDVESNTKWYAMQHGFTDGVYWIKNYLAK